MIRMYERYFPIMRSEEGGGNIIISARKKGQAWGRAINVYFASESAYYGIGIPRAGIHTRTISLRLYPLRRYIEIRRLISASASVVGRPIKKDSLSLPGSLTSDSCMCIRRLYLPACIYINATIKRRGQGGGGGGERRCVRLLKSPYLSRRASGIMLESMSLSGGRDRLGSLIYPHKPCVLSRRFYAPRSLIYSRCSVFAVSTARFPSLSLPRSPRLPFFPPRSSFLSFLFVRLGRGVTSSFYFSRESRLRL